MAKLNPTAGAKWHTAPVPEGVTSERYIYCTSPLGGFRIRCMPYRIDAAALAVRTITDELRRRAFAQAH